MIASIPRMSLAAVDSPAVPRRWALRLASGAVVDALACLFLVLSPHLPPGAADLEFVVLHLMAAAIFMPNPKVQSSRHWLAFVAVLTLPLAGIGVAGVVLGVTGRGTARRLRLRPAARRRAIDAETAARLADQVSTCDALSGNEEERCAALATLARRGDKEALLTLRWAASGRDPDLALAAALVLDQLHERLERRRREPSIDRVLRHAAG